MAPEIPPLAEAGVPGYEALSWLMVVARAGTPPETVRALHTALKAIMAQPDVQDQIRLSGLLAVDSPPPEQGAATASSVAPAAWACSTISSPVVPWPVRIQG